MRSNAHKRNCRLLIVARNEKYLEVTLYQPDSPCNQCHATKLNMARPGKNLPGIPFKTITADEAIEDQLRIEGHTGYPVVKVQHDGATWSWSGYRRDDIQKLAELLIR